ncbi:replication initiation protein [Clostridium botulinum B str. Eklund 17B (NRP)]|uniref:Replication initiation protein n=1 Tax=Clostridium botulinum (strain Eklund 17B / Type B) TaxID=935198 RepID=B2TP08_CLOBB|nr:replication initiation protein [Clostridium botulinum B str. Eklund 17B (NRP)]MCR1273466.1 DnaD domain protein [Clostridium botulinum]CDH91685.1 putative replication and membrane attachment protein [Clostridium botulinum B str. Eklund 17B (NRP)]
MAEKRMFSKTIIDSDAFLDMPLSTQALYFHLSMRADDDGFLNNAKKIMRLICANQNDYDLLLAKRFTIQFDDGICVIKHWRINNYLRKDRYKETIYKEEKAQLRIKENGTYTLNKDIGEPLVYQHETQIRLDETRLEKNSIDKNRLDKNSKSSIVVSNVEVFKHFEKCGFMVTPMLMEKISADIEVYGSQWLIDAATEALERGKINNYKYVIGIIQNWQTEGRDSKKNTKTINSKNQPKPFRFNNFEARDYDYDSLEKKLLGWEDNDNEHGED